MGAMIRDSLARYPAVFEASVLGVLFFVMFTAILVMVFRRKAQAGYERASRLPLEIEE